MLHAEAVASEARVAVCWHWWTEWERVEPVWRAIAAARGDTSFFLGVEWIRAWLQVFGAELEARLAVLSSDGAPVGVCLVSRVRRRILLLPITRYSLNCSGENDEDTPYLEFNTLLCLAGWEDGVARALVEQLGEEHWDEFAVDGCRPGPAYTALRRHLSQLDVELAEDWRHCHYIDLAELRRTGTSYEAALSGNMRGQLRRKARVLARRGELTVRAASSVEEALEDWNQLAEMARARWDGRGRSTPFHSQRFLLFHRLLLRSCLEQGAAQVLRIEAGASLLGYLYCLVHKRQVYLYQSGMRYAEDRSQSPGLVAIGQVVSHYLAAGMDDFDFLAGEERYKRCLSTAARPLVWAVFRRRSLKQKLLGVCRELRGRMRQRERTC